MMTLEEAIEHAEDVAQDGWFVEKELQREGNRALANLDNEQAEILK